MILQKEGTCNSKQWTKPNKTKHLQLDGSGWLSDVQQTNKTGLKTVWITGCLQCCYSSAWREPNTCNCSIPSMNLLNISECYTLNLPPKMPELGLELIWSVHFPVGCSSIGTSYPIFKEIHKKLTWPSAWSIVWFMHGNKSGTLPPRNTNLTHHGWGQNMVIFWYSLART